LLLNHLEEVENLCNMEPKEVLKILSDYKNSSNKDLISVMDFLQNDFEKTKDLILKLTKHLDTTEDSYNKVFEEYKKRMNNAG
jgi:hypothetical protein